MYYSLQSHSFKCLCPFLGLSGAARIHSRLELPSRHSLVSSYVFVPPPLTVPFLSTPFFSQSSEHVASRSSRTQILLSAQTSACQYGLQRLLELGSTRLDCTHTLCLHFWSFPLRLLSTGLGPKLCDVDFKGISQLEVLARSLFFESG